MTYLSLSFAVYVLSNYESALMPQCQINRHEVLQAEVREKDSQMPQDRSVNNAPNDLPLSTADFHFFKHS